MRPSDRLRHRLMFAAVLLLIATLLPPLSRAQQNGSLQFDGTNDYARTANMPLLQQYTVEAWVRRSADIGAYQTIFSDADSSYSQAMLTLYVDSGNNDCGATDQFAFYQLSGNVVLCSGVTATVGSWYHVAVTRDSAGSLRIFVNGVLRATRASAPAPADSSAPLTLGRAGETNSEYFAGQINAVRVLDSAIYTTSFTPATLGVLPGTIALYLLDEGAGQSIADSSGNGRNGTLGASTAAESADPVWTTERPQGGASTATTTGQPTALLTATATGLPTATATAIGLPTATAITLPTPTPSTIEAQIGRWDAPIAFPVPAVHNQVQPNGEILFWDQANGGLGAYAWVPGSAFFTPVPNTTTNLFCAGQSSLPDGRLFVAGGHLNENFYGLPNSNIYDPVTRRWTRTANMTYARWYPTVTQLADGRMLATSGYRTPGVLATIPEVYDPATNTWTQLTGANLSVPMYSFMFVLQDGRVFNAGPSTTTRILDVNAQTWTTVGNSLITGHSAVMYAPGRIMKSGTLGDPDNPVSSVHGRTVVIDMNQSTPAWRETQAMAFPRAYHTLTILPDGSVFANGGERTAIGNTVSQAVYDAELWNPTTETWTTMARQQRPRMYHSTSLLLPDGRVLSAGGEYPPYYESNAEIYSPPYLFRGPRPTISSAPSAISYGAGFSVTTPNAAQIAKVALIRLPAVTHGINMSQRYVPLSFSQAANGLNLVAPASAAMAPPGTYMLFIVDTNGVPSVASMVQLSGTSAPTVTPLPTNIPTNTPTSVPTNTPTSVPTNTPTSVPTNTPTSVPTNTPTSVPTNTPTVALVTSTPTLTATEGPTSTPTSVPTNTPTSAPTLTPTLAPTLAATPPTGRFALLFDGTNDIARRGAIAGTPQTIEAWVRPGVANENGLIVGQASQNRGWSLELESGRAAFWVADSSGQWRVARNASVRLAAGQWYHIAVTYSGTSARVYVGGAQGPATNVGTLAAGPDFQLGGIVGAPFFNGEIDEVRISSTVRYTAAFTPPGRFQPDASTLALYHFDEGTGQTSGDSTGNGYTLTSGTAAGADSADPTWVVATAPGQ